MLHTCKYRVFSTGTDAFSCPFFTNAFICTQKRREWLGTLIWYNGYTKLDALAQGNKLRTITAPPSPCELTTFSGNRATGRKQPLPGTEKNSFNHTLSIKQQPEGIVGENNSSGQQHNQVAYEDIISNGKLTAPALYYTSYVYGTKVPPPIEFKICTFLAPRWSHTVISSSKVGVFSWRSSEKKRPVS